VDVEEKVQAICPRGRCPGGSNAQHAHVQQHPAVMRCRFCPHDAMLARYILCPSVRRHCTKTVTRRITQIRMYDSRGNLVFRCQKSRRNSNSVTPNGAPNRNGV